MALKIHFAAGRRDEVEDGAGGRAFAAARFADETERLALVDRKADAIDRADEAMLAVQEPSACEGEVDLKVADIQERTARRGGRLRFRGSHDSR